MRYTFCLLAFLLLSVVGPGAFSEGLEHPKQWQYQPGLEVPPGPIPRDRCVRAVYLSDALKKERGVQYWEQWDPPITDQMSHWLNWYRDRNQLRVEFCDQIKI
ncbi:MAG: hypothetical protein CMM81_20015 [Rhodospirillales bacterium]|nr:hypothetical protein [Rhodospirillales bacterium]